MYIYCVSIHKEKKSDFIYIHIYLLVICNIICNIYNVYNIYSIMYII